MGTDSGKNNNNNILINKLYEFTHIFGNQNVPLTKILPLPAIVKGAVGEEGCLQIV